ncbi:hypothetical protein GGX14DRAFT_567856 [Mycena pura]|uniref:Uncharacterized protein n=1 Tax=Mycena pura TaxID=153505 RepID=A0AAD6VGX4_9AGAR|nr:hypothetical protein GGX14DRAFT_567856 [Mycena pura]
MTEVYAKCAVNTPPVGSLPPRDQFPTCIAKAELELEFCAITSADRLHAISNCLFLCRVSMMLSGEDDYASYLEMKMYRSALQYAF